MKVIESEFSNNSADYGGAISGEGAEIIDSVFSSNHAEKYGGAIRCSENGVKLTNCTFKDNFPDDVSEKER